MWKWPLHSGNGCYESSTGILPRRKYKKEDVEEFGGRSRVVEEHKRCLTLGLWLRKLATTQTPSRFAPFS